MPEHSPAQKQYLLRVKREKNLIRVSRTLLFLGFQSLWEISARLDRFLYFQQPVRNLADFSQDAERPVSVYTYRNYSCRNTGKFCIYGSSGYRHSCPSLGMSQTVTSS